MWRGNTGELQDEKKLSSFEASAPNFAVSQTTYKLGPRRQDGRTMHAILNLQSYPH